MMLSKLDVMLPTAPVTLASVLALPKPSSTRYPPTNSAATKTRVSAKFGSWPIVRVPFLFRLFIVAKLI